MGRGGELGRPGRSARAGEPVRGRQIWSRRRRLEGGDSNRVVDLRSDGPGPFFFPAPETRAGNREKEREEEGRDEELTSDVQSSSGGWGSAEEK